MAMDMGARQELLHEHNGRQLLDAIIVMVAIPEFEDWNSMKYLEGYFSTVLVSLPHNRNNLCRGIPFDSKA